MNRRMMNSFISFLMFSNILFAVNVTFQVDMQNEDTSNGVYLVGYWEFEISYVFFSRYNCATT